MKKIDSIKLISMIGLALAGAASLISDYARQKEMKEMVETSVNEAIANKEREMEKSE